MAIDEARSIKFLLDISIGTSKIRGAEAHSECQHHMALWDDVQMHQVAVQAIGNEYVGSG